jgi:uncharacterized membrane protein YbhN (UPF0104 family)
MESRDHHKAVRNRVSIAVKGVVTAALVAVLAKNVDMKAMSSRFLLADPAWLAAALVFLAAQLVVSALRWQHICERLGLRIAQGACIRLVFIGHFFSQALPTSIGGDVVRAWLAARETGAAGRSISSVLCDRAIAFGVLLVMASVAQALVGNELHNPALAALRLFLWGMTAAAVAWLAFGADLARPFARFKIGGWVRRVLVDVRSVTGPPWTLTAAILALSLVVQLSLVTGAYCIGRSLALPLDVVTCLVMIPPILVATFIPVSIGGWGVREGAMVLGLGMVGVPADGALALSILFGVGNLVVASPGGLLWITARGRGPVPLHADAAEIEETLAAGEADGKSEDRPRG